MTGLVASVAQHQAVLVLRAVAHHAPHRLEPVDKVPVLEDGPLVTRRYDFLRDQGAVRADPPNDTEARAAERAPALDRAPLQDTCVAKRVHAAVDDASSLFDEALVTDTALAVVAILGVKPRRRGGHFER